MIGGWLGAGGWGAAPGGWGLGAGTGAGGWRLGATGWDEGYLLAAVRCGLGGSPELNHRLCCFLTFAKSFYFLQFFKNVY